MFQIHSDLKHIKYVCVHSEHCELSNIYHNLLFPLQGCDAFSQSGLYSNHQDIGPRYAVSFSINFRVTNIAYESSEFFFKRKRCQTTSNQVIGHAKDSGVRSSCSSCI